MHDSIYLLFIILTIDITELRIYTHRYIHQYHIYIYARYIIDILIKSSYYNSIIIHKWRIILYINKKYHYSIRNRIDLFIIWNNFYSILLYVPYYQSIFDVMNRYVSIICMYRLFITTYITIVTSKFFINEETILLIIL